MKKQRAVTHIPVTRAIFDTNPVRREIFVPESSSEVAVLVDIALIDFS
jgi:hypothetical protein